MAGLKNEERYRKHEEVTFTEKQAKIKFLGIPYSFFEKIEKGMEKAAYGDAERPYKDKNGE